jgi:hypothetical protein
MTGFGSGIGFASSEGVIDFTSSSALSLIAFSTTIKELLSISDPALIVCELPSSSTR